MPEDRSFHFIVVRKSDEECTFASVTGELTPEGLKRYKEEFRHNHVSYFVRTRVELAVTEWIKTTKDGKDAWRESDRDFNIGDLAGHIDMDLDLIRCLEERGIVQLSIECEGNTNVSPSWTYDMVLVNEEVL